MNDQLNQQAYTSQDVDKQNTDLGISRPAAQELLERFIKDPITRMHCIESEAIMKNVAKRLGEDEEKWGTIGLLHDIDWELTKTNTLLHGIKAADILKDGGGSEYLIETIQSHVYNQGFGEDFHGPPEFKSKMRTGHVQHALAASETLTGIIIAATLVQPDKKLMSVKPESLMKKFRSKNFAANCRREIVMECEEIGIPLDEFLNIGLKSLQDIHEQLGL
jgi:putative nucleotidyltransferase with HDIG domain